jgi:hypothetical protein
VKPADRIAVRFTANAQQEENVPQNGNGKTVVENILARLAQKIGAMLMCDTNIRDEIEFVEDFRECPELVRSNELYVTMNDDTLPVIRIVIEGVTSDQIPRLLSPGDTIIAKDEMLNSTTGEWEPVSWIRRGTRTKPEERIRRFPIN